MIDEFHWGIIAFVVSWAPYGGPKDEETLPAFGLNSERLTARFVDVVRTLMANPVADLSADRADLLATAANLLQQMSISRTRRLTVQSSSIGLSDEDGQWTLRRGSWHWSPHPLMPKDRTRTTIGAIPPTHEGRAKFARYA